jgi:hypothetical protein
MGKTKPHHAGSYASRAAKVRAYAYADPDTRCWRCGKTLDQHRHRDGSPAVWNAGHVIDGQVGGLLMPEASSCNKSAGATYRNRTRRRPYYRRIRTYW